MNKIITKTKKCGCIESRLDKKYHNDNDKPAFIACEKCIKKYPDKAIYNWYQHGMIHRDADKPAAIFSDGQEEWYQYGKRHRIGNAAVINPGDPAVDFSDCWKEWFVKGKRHRLNAPACIVGAYRYLEYWEFGKRIHKKIGFGGVFIQY